MKKLIFILGAAIVVGLAFAINSVTDRGGPWLPLLRSDILRVLSEDTTDAAIRMEIWNAVAAEVPAKGLLEEQARRLQAKRTRELETEKARLANALSAGESVWIATNPAIPLSVVMAGKDDRIHTVRVTVPIVNYSKTQSERALKVLSELFRLAYPDWTEAKDWPIRSLTDAWNTFGRKDIKTANDRIVRKELNGMTSATFGVPPDIVVYTITARAHCVPTADGNPFQRVIC